MRLSKECIEHISNTQKTRLKIAMVLGISEDWVKRLIKKNETNSILTLAATIEVIKSESGMSYSEIIDTDIKQQVLVD